MLLRIFCGYLLIGLCLFVVCEFINRQVLAKVFSKGVKVSRTVDYCRLPSTFLYYLLCWPILLFYAWMFGTGWVD